MRLHSRDGDAFYRNNIFFLKKDGTIDENPRNIVPGQYKLEKDPIWNYFILTKVEDES